MRRVLFDANRHVHLCSLTPSFEVFPVAAYATSPKGYNLSEEEREALSEAEDLLLASEEPVNYLNVSDVLRMPRRPTSLSRLRNGVEIPEREPGEGCESYYRRAYPDLVRYDVLLVNSSAGKDSQAMLDRVVHLARAQGVADRIVVVHCDLGRVEWQGTAELAEAQARAYGCRFVKVSRPQGDLLTHVEARGMWPSSTARYCTSDHKRGQVHKVMTALTGEVRARMVGYARPVRILNMMGIRADESPARAKKVSFARDALASNGKREVDVWYPIFAWTVDEVWTAIRASGVPHHRAYDLGMPRLSCCFCVLASRDALLLAGKHNRPLLDAYVAVEARIGHTFKKSLPIVQVRDALDRGEEPRGKIRTWCM